MLTALSLLALQYWNTLCRMLGKGGKVMPSNTGVFEKLGGCCISPCLVGMAQSKYLVLVALLIPDKT